MASLEALDDDHASATVWARLGEGRRLAIIVAVGIVGFGLRRRHGKELTRQGQILDPMAVSEEAIMADPVEALRQHVHEETANELVYR